MAEESKEDFVIVEDGSGNGNGTGSDSSDVQQQNCLLDQQSEFLLERLAEVEDFIDNGASSAEEEALCDEQRSIIINELRSIEDRRLAVINQKVAIADVIKEMSDTDIARRMGRVQAADHTDTARTVEQICDHIHQLGFAPTVKCAVCGGTAELAFTLPCQHNYCRQCTTKFFMSAIQDTSLIPIRCCRMEIDQSIARDVLDDENYFKFKQYLKEATCKNKMYW